MTHVSLCSRPLSIQKVPPHLARGAKRAAGFEYPPDPVPARGVQQPGAERRNGLRPALSSTGPRDQWTDVGGEIVRITSAPAEAVPPAPGAQALSLSLPRQTTRNGGEGRLCLCHGKLRETEAKVGKLLVSRRRRYYLFSGSTAHGFRVAPLLILVQGGRDALYLLDKRSFFSRIAARSARARD